MSADFSEIKPKEGVVVKMEKGNIVTEKISETLAKAPPKEELVKKESVKKEPVKKESVKREPLKNESLKETAKKESLIESGFEYYKLVTDKVRSLALLNYPKGVKGRVGLVFTLAKDGSLVDEPYVSEADNSALIPFALKAINSASSFPSFPTSLKKEKETFKISLSYE